MRRGGDGDVLGFEIKMNNSLYSLSKNRRAARERIRGFVAKAEGVARGGRSVGAFVKGDVVVVLSCGET